MKIQGIMKWFAILSLGGLVYAPAAQAQEPNFSMYHYTPFFTDPGQIGAVEDVRLMLNYRNQAIEVDDNIKTSTVSLYYPFYMGNHRLVVAGSFLNDKASNFLATNGGMIGAAYSVMVSSRASLSLGLQGGYFQRNVESNFITDDQYIDGVYDPNVVSSDAVLRGNKSYPTISGGLYYQAKDESNQEKAFVGLSFFNMNKPDVSIVEDFDDTLPLTLKATGGYRIYEGMKLSVMPTMRWVHETENDFFNLGTRLGYALTPTEEGVKKIELGVWYHTNKLGIFSLAYEQPNLTVGVSYDIPTGTDLNTAQNGIFELAVSFRLKQKKGRPVKSVNEETNKALTETMPQEEEVAAETEDAEDTQEEETPVAAQPEKNAPASPKKPEPTTVESKDPFTPEEKAVLAKNVHFDFNTNELDASSREFLDEVAGILKDKEDVQIQLVGHTCNVGAENVNQQLSLQRAESVKAYLVTKGIAADRFTVTGMGEKQPLADNATEEGRRENRRVAFMCEY